MASASKRRPRVISVDDEEGSEGDSPSKSGNSSSKDESPRPLFGSRSARKPFRQSGLRNTLSHGDDAGNAEGGTGAADDGDEPAVIRPSVSRTGSSKLRKKNVRSRLSFGGEAADPDDADGEQVVTPSKGSLLHKAADRNTAAKRGASLRGLLPRTFQNEDAKPTYSKQYLDELQSSTPNTPQDISSLRLSDADEMELDASELEGALIVESPSRPMAETAGTRVFSEAEIHERKERRARLAKEQNFLSVEDEEPGQKKKDDTRLLAEDEDLGEGFDDFVEDGGLTLGDRAQSSRQKQERRQMAELISAAEGHSSNDSSDSDAERRIAYEAAQTRAGMDGLEKPKAKPDEDFLRVPPKMTPLPGLADCLARLRSTIETMGSEMTAKRARVAQLRSEKEEIAKREVEVQAMLDQVGRKYQEAMDKGKGEGLKFGNGGGDGRAAELVGERGLESLGTTPRRGVEVDGGDDVVMGEGEADGDG